MSAPSISVVKFGGAVLRSAEGFRRMLGIVQSLLAADSAETPTQSAPPIAAPPSTATAKAPNPRILIVVSAFASTTRNLEQMAREALIGKGALAQSLLEEVLDLHRGFMRDVLTPENDPLPLNELISNVGLELQQLLEGVEVTRQLTPRTLDKILSYGELLALHITRHVLSWNGVDAGWTDARRVIVTDDSFGEARPLPEKSRVMIHESLKPLLESHACVLVQGFVGATEDGVVTTMGRESSTLTATLLAELLQAKAVTLYSDVEGVRSADPHQFSNTVPRPSMSYDQAAIAARHGLKLLYATTIEPAKRAGLPVEIVSAEHPQGAKTVIGPTGPDECPIVLHQPHQVAVVLANHRRVLQVVGLLAAEFHDSASWNVIAVPDGHSVVISCEGCTTKAIAGRLHELLIDRMN